MKRYKEIDECIEKLVVQPSVDEINDAIARALSAQRQMEARMGRVSKAKLRNGWRGIVKPRGGQL
jgi:hypothetical protein